MWYMYSLSMIRNTSLQYQTISIVFLKPEESHIQVKMDVSAFTLKTRWIERDIKWHSNTSVPEPRDLSGLYPITPNDPQLTDRSLRTPINWLSKMCRINGLTTTVCESWSSGWRWSRPPPMPAHNTPPLLCFLVRYCHKSVSRTFEGIVFH